MLTDVKLF